MSRLGKEITAYTISIFASILIVGLVVTPATTPQNVWKFVQAWAVFAVLVTLFAAASVGLTWLFFTIYGKYQDWVSKNVI